MHPIDTLATRAGDVAPGVSTFFALDGQKPVNTDLSLADVHRIAGNEAQLREIYTGLPVKHAAEKAELMRGYKEQFGWWRFQLRWVRK